MPQGAGDAASYGGLAAFTIEDAGTYRVGLSEPAWVDVTPVDAGGAAAGAPAEAVAFGPGAECSGIRKQVSFDLAPGEYVLEVSGNLDADVGVLVMPAGAG